MSFWDQLVQTGATYVKHVGIIKQVVDAAPDQRIAIMTSYVRGLSDQSFAGFKVLMLNTLSEEKSAQAKSILQSLLKNLDAVRAGQRVAANVVSPPAAAADAAPSMSAEDAFLADAHFCNEQWWKEPDMEKRRIKVVDTLIGFDEPRYKQFIGHVHQMKDNHMTHVRAHQANELNAWGSYFEDRMNYFAARERTGQRDPTWLKGMEELQVILADMDWLINACEQFWPLIQKKQAAAQQRAAGHNRLQQGPSDE